VIAPAAARRIRRLGLAGLLLCAAALGVAAATPSALAGWLAAFVFWAGLPIGALCLSLMMRLIPGAWRDELESRANAAMLLLPLSAAAAVPVLVALPALYPWAATGGGEEHRLYLTPWFFILRTIAFFACTLVLALLLTRRGRTAGLAAGGLILFVLIDTTIAVDWLMSLDPEFHSSGFGLYILSIQAATALAVLLLGRLVAGAPSEKTGILGGLLLTALLLWAYLAFMQYFIIWSDNLPASVAWYARRGDGPWWGVELAIGALGVGPILLLLFPPVRQSRGWLIALAGATLVGKTLETAWLVLPGSTGGVPALAVAALALAGLGLLNLSGLARIAAAPGAAEMRRLFIGEGRP
jgi:hypothetical protein